MRSIDLSDIRHETEGLKLGFEEQWPLGVEVSDETILFASNMPARPESRCVASSMRPSQSCLCFLMAMLLLMLGCMSL
jgi:hypothetical protein